MRLSTLVLAIGVALSTPALAETNTQTKGGESGRRS
ncbi:Uncharacterised protein [Serratia fonticola]|uniref:Uncharacterized protein n=1 Tax=Serratia fonticola TaxID=47917 RepID=A0A4U9VFE7_SERFO|nr:Uncharacterised protein [Serratia fonticola]